MKDIEQSTLFPLCRFLLTEEGRAMKHNVSFPSLATVRTIENHVLAERNVTALVIRFCKKEVKDRRRLIWLLFSNVKTACLS